MRQVITWLISLDTPVIYRQGVLQQSEIGVMLHFYKKKSTLTAVTVCSISMDLGAEIEYSIPNCIFNCVSSSSMKT